MHAFGFFSAFVNPIGLGNIGWKYYLAYVVYTFLEVRIYSLSPSIEIKGLVVAANCD
jgi:hypothetical protein